MAINVQIQRRQNRRVRALVAICLGNRRVFSKELSENNTVVFV